MTSAALPALPRRPPRRRVALPRRLGRARGRRRLLPGDVPGRAARLSAQLRADSNLRAWVLTIAHRKALDHHRARSAQRRCRSRSVPEVARHDPPSRATTASGRRVARAAAQAARRRAAALRRRPQPPEVAAALGCREEAARRSAHEGLQEAAPGDEPHDRHDLAPPPSTPTPPRPPPRASPPPRRARRRLRRRRLARSARSSPPATERGLVRLAYEDFNGGVDAVLDSARRAPLAADPRGAGAARRRAPRARRVLRRAAHGVRPRRSTGRSSTPLRPPRPAGDRARSRSAQTDLRRGRRAGGQPEAPSRAAGSALGANPIPIVVPCHRVAAARAASSPATPAGCDRKEALLALEGARV